MERIPVIADVDSEEALRRLDEIEILSQSIEDWDRIEAAESMLSAMNHQDPKVVSKGLDIAQWLLTNELAGQIDDSLIEVEPDSDNILFVVEVDGRRIGLAQPENYQPLIMTHPQIQKAMVRELMYATMHQDRECSNRGLLMLGIMALDSQYSTEAIRALGYAGSQTEHTEIAKDALEMLNSLVYAFSPGKFMNFEEHMDSLFMAINAISKRSEDELIARANEIRFQALETELKDHPGIIEKSLRSYLMGMNSYGWNSRD